MSRRSSNTKSPTKPKNKKNTDSLSSSSPKEKLYDCSKCRSNVKDEDDGLMCEMCFAWFHRKCANISEAKYRVLSQSDGTEDGILWFCKECVNAQRSGHQVVAQKLDSVLGLIQELREELATVKKQKEILEENFDSRVKNIISEEREKERRKDSVVFYNIEDSHSSEEECAEKDKDILNSIIGPLKEGANVDNSCVSIMRLGTKKDSSKPRPLKVAFKDGSGLKRKVLKSKEEGKWEKKFSNIKVSPDRTQLEREEYRTLVKELIQRKENGEKDIIIRNNKIVSINSVPLPDRNGQKRSGQ